MKTERLDGPLESLLVVPDDFDPAGGFPLVVLLHGYGADMHDLAGLAPEIDPHGYAYLLPNAPLTAFTGGDPTARAWYERGGAESPQAVRFARDRLQALLEAVWPSQGTPPGKTVLAGFSQGGNLALRHGLPSPEVFAGVASLAGSLSKLDDLAPELPAKRGQRLFVAHGYRDATVPYQVGRNLADYLARQGYRPEFQSYTIGHGITRPVLDDLRRWLVATVRPIRTPIEE